MPATLSETFRSTALRHPRRIAIQWKKDNQWTDLSYAALAGKVDSISALLSARGIKKGDRAGILLENRPEWPAIFFGIISTGAVCVPINPEASREEIENILTDSDCRIVFVKDVSHYPFIKNAISVDSAPTQSGEPSGHPVQYPISSDDIACILYTSGTTDAPKGVMLSHGNLGSNSSALHEANIFTEKDSIVSVLPLHHAYSLTVTMIFPLVYGIKIVYPGAISGEAVLKALKEVNPAVFVAVPRIIYSFHTKIAEKLAKIPFPLNALLKIVIELFYKIRNVTGINLARIFFGSIHRKFGKSMRLFVTGGAKLNENTERDLFKFGFTVLEGYGLTETSPVLTLNSPKSFKIGSAGLPVPGVEIKISDKNKEGIGEVLARGPNIMEGYYKKDDLTAGVIKDGWFHTGDLGYLDKDGYLFLTGRSKDVIVLSSGLNIYPEEVEEAYLRNTPIKELCVFEAPARKGVKESEVLWAVVVPDLEFFRKNNEINLREVLKGNIGNISGRLLAQKRIMGFTITFDKLPRTILGKIKRFAVKERYSALEFEEGEYVSSASKELSAAERDLLERPSSKNIVDYLKKEMGLKNIRLGDSLELDLGIDSLKRIELMAGFENAYRIKIEGEGIWKAFTVKELIEAIGHLLPEEAEAAPFPKEEPRNWKGLLATLPNKETIKDIDLKPGFGALVFSILFGCFLSFLVRMFSRVKREGLKNIPKKGPYIMFANHTSYFDGPLIVITLPHSMRFDLFFVGFRAYFNIPVVRRLIKIARIIPLDFSAQFMEALRSSYYVLKNGKNLCFFPEGMRTFDGKMVKFKRGFGILAKESGAKLLPVLIEGAFECWPRTSALPRRYPMKVKFGKPIDVKDMEKKGLEMGAADSYEAICLAARETLLNIAKE